MSSVDLWLAVAVVVGVFAALAATRLAPYLVLLAGLTVLLVSGVIDSQQALVGFANEGMITVGLLFVVASGMRESGLTALVVEAFLGRPNSVRAAQARLARFDQFWRDLAFELRAEDLYDGDQAIDDQTTVNSSAADTAPEAP